MSLASYFQPHRNCVTLNCKTSLTCTSLRMTHKRQHTCTWVKGILYTFVTWVVSGSAPLNFNKLCRISQTVSQSFVICSQAAGLNTFWWEGTIKVQCYITSEFPWIRPVAESFPFLVSGAYVSISTQHWNNTIFETGRGYMEILSDLSWNPRSVTCYITPGNSAQ